jgi:hypothetical protein
VYIHSKYEIDCIQPVGRNIFSFMYSLCLKKADQLCLDKIHPYIENIEQSFFRDGQGTCFRKEILFFFSESCSFYISSYT